MFEIPIAILKRTAAAVLCAVLVSCALCPGGGRADAANSPAQREEPAVAAVNSLAVDIYKKLAEDGKNLCFSPYSISAAFAMTYAGAKGETAAEMRRVFHYGEGIHDANRILSGNLLSAPEGAGELSIANSIWPAKGSRLLGNFDSVVRKDYLSEVKPQDYRRHAERSRGIINDWVAEKTRDRITDILTPGSVRSDTKMILVNAIYFKAPWMSEFSESKTTDADFYVSPGEVTGVRMMEGTDSFQYADFGDAQVLKLPYRQGVFSMLLLLPKEASGLKDLEERLSLDRIARYRNELERRKVNVYLPKFKTEQTFELASALSALGVKRAFHPGMADFSGITGRKGLYINTAVHKAFVEIDEAGTEAAAATVIGMRLSLAPIDKPEDIAVFRADHPFIYMIQDELSGAILFMGKVAQP